MPSYDLLFNAAVTLLVLMDPIGTASLFVTLTAGLEAAHRRGVAIRGAVIAFLVLALFALTGTTVLDAMGITIDAFRVAGGLLLFFTAFEMIYGGRQERKAQSADAAAADAANRAADLAVFPLAIPLLAGPGTISATILLSSQLSSEPGVPLWSGTLVLIGLLLAIVLLTVAVLIAAEALDKYLSRIARSVLTRLLGVLLAALSVQFVADGVRALAQS